MKKYTDIKTIGYPEYLEIELNKNKYKIYDVISNEDIIVDDSQKYPILQEVTKPNENRIFDGCRFQSLCGGCVFMHTNYEYELKKKKEYLNELFSSFKFDIKINEMDDPYHYRNKSMMTYKISKRGNVVCGFYEEHSHKLVPVTNCMLQSDKTNILIDKINKILTKNKIKPYDENTRQGVLRHIYIRHSTNYDQIMVVFVTNGIDFPGRGNILKDIKKENLKIDTIVQNINPRDTSIVLGDTNKVLYGPGFIYEKVSDYKFKISPNSFFQVNTKGMEILYNLAIKKANLKKTDIVLDAYSGVGTISIFVSKYVKEVISVELNKNAVKDAIINAKINNINNIDFVEADATSFITNAAKNKEKIDVIIMDPPRDGSTKQFINAVSYLNVKKVIYISCGPESLKRDLYQFSLNNYHVESIEAVDMFPKTMHVETVCLLIFRSAPPK